MSKRQAYERFVWFHQRVKQQAFPNASHLVHEFEITERTARRDIEFMRDRLLAPLVYTHARRGYHYADEAFELPSDWINESNVLSLALAARLASTVPDQTIKDDLCRLTGKVVGAGNSKGRSCFEQISTKISVKNIEYARVDERCFRLAIRSLLDDSALKSMGV